MFDNFNIVDRYEQEGYVIVPLLFDLERVNQLRLICDRILEDWFDRNRYRQKPRRKNCS